MHMIRVACPAKVNLFLAVGPKVARGYHPIRTVFQAIGIFDRLKVSLSESDVDEWVCDWPDLPKENTLTHALRLVRELIAVPPLRIELEKAIPDQTGLGGGSSDAAALLRALPHMVSTPFEAGFLADVAAAVGKDVPFFLLGGRARGEGYGERLTPLPDADSRWLAVVRPESGCATREAYARLDALDFPFLDFSEEGGLYNDFERVAPRESLDQIGRLMAYGAEGALLCGSGSGVFGVFADEAAAHRAVHRLAEDSTVRAWAAPTLSRAESLAMELG